MQTIKDIFIRCDCHDTDHYVLLSEDSWGDEQDSKSFTISVTKTPVVGVFHRVKRAFKTLFNIGETSHDYCEVILNDESIAQMKKFIENYETYKATLK